MLIHQNRRIVIKSEEIERRRPIVAMTIVGVNKETGAVGPSDGLGEGGIGQMISEAHRLMQGTRRAVRPLVPQRSAAGAGEVGCEVSRHGWRWFGCLLM